MAIFRPNQLPAATTPLSPTDLVVVDQGVAGVNAADPQDVVDAAAPVASLAEAEAGADNTKRMTALRTKQSIASEVGVTIASKAQGDKADSAVQPARQIIAGAGLTGGGDLSADRTLNVGAGTGITVNADDVSLSATTISRLLPAAGTTSQVLQKASNTDYDVAWATVSAATAVSYAPQTLTSGEQLQARTNIGLSNVDNTSDANKPISTATQTALNLKQNISTLAFGQCQLTLASGNLSLGRFNGRLLTINGVHETIPSTPPTLAATSLTPSTLYYIYAFMNSGTMTLEASTTAYTTDTTTGVVIKSGDTTRTLVGMARPIAGPAWVDSATQRFVRSWFNRFPLKIDGPGISTTRTTTSASLVELNSETRVEFIVWANDLCQFSTHGTAFSSGSFYCIYAVGIDGASTFTRSSGVFGASGGATTSTDAVALSEGYHYATFLGAASGGTASFFVGSGSLGPCRVTGVIGL
jgi:hypothetical protein